MATAVTAFGSKLFCLAICLAITASLPWEYQSDSYSNWAVMGSRLHQPKCIQIPSDLHLCANIGYTKMRLPNILEHETTSEVVDQARSWVPLVNVKCSQFTRMFLCSLFAPVCLQVTDVVKPCRSLCTMVRSGCEEIMNRYNYTWPEMLNCNRFPKPSESICIEPPKTTTPIKTGPERPDVSCRACRNVSSVERILDAYCSADIVMRVKVRGMTRQAGTTKMVALRKRRFFKNRSKMPKSEIRRSSLIVGKGCECKGIRSGRAPYMIMGRKGERRNEIVVTQVVPWKKRDQAFKKALRMMREKGVCERDGLNLAINGWRSLSSNNQRNKREKEARRRRKKEARASPWRGSRRARRTQGRGDRLVPEDADAEQ